MRRANYRLPRIVFEATRECNLRCHYCYNPWRRSEEQPASATFSDASRTLRKLMATVDFSHITFSGGEPMLTDGIAELILACRMRGKTVTLITNGTSATAGEYGMLVKLGVELFELPLLATVPETHDYLTGVPGSFNNVLATLETLLSLQAELCTVFVMTKHNIGTIVKVMELASSLGIRHFMLARFNIGGRGILEPERLLPSVKELHRAFDAANHYAMTHPLRISANVCLPRCVISSEQYTAIPISTCSPRIADRPVTVDYEGNVRICNHSPHIVGNIHQESMDTLLSSDYVKEWETSRPAFCADCASWTTCGGGCRAAAEQCGGTLADEDPAISRWRREVDEPFVVHHLPTN